MDQTQMKTTLAQLLQRIKELTPLNSDEAMKLCEEAMDLAKSHHLIDEQGWIFLNQSLIERIRSNTTPMLTFAYQANEIFQKTHNIEGQIRANNLISIAYFYYSLFESALTYGLRALELMETFRNDALHCSVLNNLGEVYRETGNNKKAIDYYNQALSISKKLTHLSYTAAIYSNLGEAYASDNDFERAQSYFHSSYDILAQENDQVNLGDLENRLSKLYDRINQYELAIDYAKSAFTRLYEIQNQYYLIDVLVNLYELKMKISDTRAIDHLLHASDMAELIASRKKQLIIYQKLSAHYESLEQYSYALEFMKKYCAINEELMISAMSTKLEILTLEMKYIKETTEFNNLRQRLEQEMLAKQMELEQIKTTNQQLEKKAYEDELTGIWNRRSINTYLKDVFEESNPQGTIALFMMDIDHFKRYNDYWGHAKGDDCIKQISQKISEIKSSNNDIFGQYGGEEFVYIARDVDANQAIDLGNQIKEAVEKIRLFYVFDEVSYPVTMSVGIAIGSIQEAKHYAHLLEMADEQLYLAKELGRNRISHTIFSL